jgi:hypothetical protein
MRSTEVPQHYAMSTEERVIGSFTYSAAEFADTAERVSTVPEGIDAMIDGRVGWGGAAQSSPFAEFLSWRRRPTKWCLCFSRCCAASRYR